MRSINIEGRMIGDNYPVFIISEIGGNFIKFSEAKKLIDLSKKAGADAVKLQTFRADTITSKTAMYDMPNTGKANQYELFKKYEIDFNLHKEIWDYCKEIGILVFSTPSHISDIELLEKLNCPVYKIGSDDAYNIPFLEEVASIGKPMILATGMCTMNEVRESVSAILGKNNSNLILLHCVTNYPADPKDVNLKCIVEMKREFNLPVGFSDHTVGLTCCIGAAAIGANVLEKHFTYDKNADGPDHILSADPEELNRLINSVRTLEIAMGDGVKRPADGEKITRINNRKSIIAIDDIADGSIISREKIAIKRPGYGIPPKYIDLIIGRIARKRINKEEPILWDDI